MSEEIEKKLLEEIEILKKEIGLISKDTKKSYRYSRITNKILDELFTIKKSYDKSIFDKWFSYNIKLNEKTISFLEELLKEEEDFINDYNEEDLKINFISPILTHVNFKMRDKKIRAFYEENLTYSTDSFTLNGTPDFFVSRGLEKPEMPYFFIQEFKRSEEFSNPRPQLLAELISGVEINGWKSIKGAYIIGATWYFVVLEKTGEDKYEYSISKLFNSTQIEDLKNIYRNLMFIKDEIYNFID